MIHLSTSFAHKVVLCSTPKETHDIHTKPNSRYSHMILKISVTFLLLITMITCMRGTESWQAPQPLALQWVRATQPRCRQSSKPAVSASERVLFETPTCWFWLRCWHKLCDKGLNWYSSHKPRWSQWPRRWTSHPACTSLRPGYRVQTLNHDDDYHPQNHSPSWSSWWKRSDAYPQTAASHLLALSEHRMKWQDLDSRTTLLWW